MKKTLVILSVFFFTGINAFAQVQPHALGLRFASNGNLNGAEISYQKARDGNNRVELDLGYGFSPSHSRIYLAGMYHWDWNLSGGLNWYIGPGAAVGFYAYDANAYINVALGGQVGMEFDFNVIDLPILLSLDVRPMWDFLGDNAGLGWGAALGLRYTW